MGKRLYWTALAGLTAVAGGNALAAPPAPLPAAQLDWQPWGGDAPSDALCRGHYVMPDYRLPAGDTPEDIRSSSDLARYDEDGTVRLAGEVLLRRGNSQVEAPEVRLGPARERAQVTGPLALRDQGLLVRGAAAEVALQSDAASVDGAHYVAHEARLRGDAQRLARLEDGRYRLSDASFTTCEPGSQAWRLVGSDILLDRESGFGTATHARLEVQDVPVFYWPWVRFPIDDRRQSGFLWPVISASGDGLDYAQPYYFNLAPNHDATLTPRFISDRGFLLGGEFRYLQQDVAGTVEGAYLADDQGKESSNPNDPTDAFSGEDRWYLDYRHQGRLSPRVDYQLAYGAASDGRYFDDFGRDFGESETAYLPRLALFDYGGETWQLEARAQGYQRLDYPLAERDKPFYRLPSLTAIARWDQRSGVYQQWRSNATYFWRNVIEQDVPVREAATGSRVHLAPALGYRADPSWGFLEPRVELLHTAYELDYGTLETERDTTLSRTVPVSSLDGGLVFERDLSAFGDAYRQTLEPRLNYAYVPAEDQQDFPDFDTSERAFSWGQLWSPYRFSGSDRVGDLNRLSAGVSSRFLEDDSGRERFNLGVGQGFYFEDRRIDMEGDKAVPEREDNYAAWYRATRDRTPLVTKVDWQISDDWSTRYEWLYDTEREVTERDGVSLAYRDPRGHALNLGYRWERQGFDPSADDPEDRLGYNREEFDVSFALRTSAHVDLIGRYLYDNTNSRSLERLAGVQWNDCCYGLQLVWRDWVEDNGSANTIADDYTDRGIFLRFIFKGLGGVGQEADTYFERAIPGYRSTAF